MKPRRQVVLTAILILTAVLSATRVRAQVDQRTIAQALLSSNSEERSRAVESARVIGANKTSPELRAALIAALAREGRAHARGYDAERRGEAVVPLDNPELIGAVARVVAELRDPQAIPALAGSLGTGFTVVRALADFGQPAAPAVLDVVTSPNSVHYAVDSGLITLRLMVERMKTRPLSPETLEEIRRAARQRLTGKQYFTTLWWAIDLAVVLNDTDLRRLVESLATDQQVIVASGVEDPELIDRTQQRARERLAGLPPMPRS